MLTVARAEVETPGCPEDVAEILGLLAGVGADLARLIQANGLTADLAAARGTNADGDNQKELDVLADEAFRKALAGSSVRYFASEEQEDVLELNPAGTLALAIDPLDGSSNIGVNVSIGTIFSLFRAADTADGSFLRPAREQVAAGYILYGPQCALVVSWGEGVRLYGLGPDGRTFQLVRENCRVAADSQEFAINASNYRHWPAPIRAYVDDRVAGSDGPRGCDFNMRWIASLVADAHRILIRGGIYLYPADSRRGYESGRLRHVYECAPIAFLMEQAGGGATDGVDLIMNAVPAGLHARTPFVFGSKDKVLRVASYFDIPKQETAALFGQRGLFRSPAR